MDRVMAAFGDNSAEVNDLIAEIERAFDGVVRGAGVSWREAEEIDNHVTEKELAAARQLDTDRRWAEVPSDLLDRLPSAVSFLDAAGFRYYLPAFMVADLRRGGRWESAVDDSFMSYLECQHRVERLLPVLSKRQKHAILKWIRHSSQRTPWARPAAEGLWSKFANA